MGISQVRQSSLTCVSSYSPVQLESTGDLRTWLRRDSHVSPSRSQEKGPEQMTSETCGPLPSTPFAQYDPDTRSWRTFQVSFLEDISVQSWEDWPKAGMIVDGVFYRLPKWERRISESDCGLWPTPRANKVGGYSSPNFRPTLEQTVNQSIGGKLNPTWVAWLMGWPLGWTDLKPLAMDKFQSWLQQHGGC